MKIFSNGSQSIVFFVQMFEKLTQVRYFFGQIGSNCAFIVIFLRKILNFSKILRRPGGSAPGPPTGPTP